MVDTEKLLEGVSVPDLLENIEGGVRNLLPVTALTSDLQVIVPMWPNSHPYPGGAEVLFVTWNGREVHQRSWEDAVPAEDLDLRIDQALLTHGEHVIGYRVRGSNLEEVDGEPLTLNVDILPPLLAAGDGPLVFADEVMNGGVTIEYLESNADKVEAQVTAYRTPEPGDTIVWYWDQEAGDNEKVDERVLDDKDYNKPLILNFDGDMIRERGDGERRAHYRVIDRAGNMSSRSEPVKLKVAAVPIPRFLPWPELSPASGSGETIVLDMNKPGPNPRAVVSADAVIHPGEQLRLQWGKPGEVGAVTITAQDAPREFVIPLDKIAAHSGRTIPMYYEVIPGNGPVLQSIVRQVRQTVFTPGYPPPVILESVGQTVLRLSDVVANAHITLLPWHLMSTDQQVRLEISGVNAEGAPVGHPLDPHVVTVEEMSIGLGSKCDLQVPKSFLQTLKLGSAFSVSATVSFDAGASWAQYPNLGILRLRLEA